MVIQNNFGCTWRISGVGQISAEDAAFIRAFDPPLYHNDISCYIWAFDTKLPSGRWLENIRVSNDLKTVQARIEP